MLAYVNRAQLIVTPAQLVWRKFLKKMISYVLDEDIREIMDDIKLIKNPKYLPLYQNYHSKEIVGLAQGMSGLVEGTNTMFFIKKIAVSADKWRDVTYGQIVVDYRPDKTNPCCTRLTVGGGRVKYLGDFSTPSVELTAVNPLLNIIVSTLNAKFMTIDIKYFNLNTLMARSKYMRLKLGNLSKSVVQHYNLAEKNTREGYVYVEIKRGVYGLPQAGLIAQQLL